MSSLNIKMEGELSAQLARFARATGVALCERCTEGLQPACDHGDWRGGERHSGTDERRARANCGHRHNCRSRVRSWRNPSAQRRSRVADGFGYGPFLDGKSCLRISDKLVRSARRRQSVPLGGPMPSSHRPRSLFGTYPAFSHPCAVEAGGSHAAR